MKGAELSFINIICYDADVCEQACAWAQESHEEPFEKQHAYAKVALGLIFTTLATFLLRFLDKAFYREQCLPKVVFRALERCYDNPERNVADEPLQREVTILFLISPTIQGLTAIIYNNNISSRGQRGSSRFPN